MGLKINTIIVLENKEQYIVLKEAMLHGKKYFLAMGLDENRKVAKMGGHAAKVAREDIEKSLGESVVTKKNALNYKYIEDEKLIEDKKLIENKKSKKKK